MLPPGNLVRKDQIGESATDTHTDQPHVRAFLFQSITIIFVCKMHGVIAMRAPQNCICAGVWRLTC